MDDIAAGGADMIDASLSGASLSGAAAVRAEAETPTANAAADPTETTKATFRTVDRICPSKRDGYSTPSRARAFNGAA
jgi:hypothetical protein